MPLPSTIHLHITSEYKLNARRKRVQSNRDRLKLSIERVKNRSEEGNLENREREKGEGEGGKRSYETHGCV
jgi:hypothetical protein